MLNRGFDVGCLIEVLLKPILEDSEWVDHQNDKNRDRRGLTSLTSLRNFRSVRYQTRVTGTTFLLIAVASLRAEASRRSAALIEPQ